MSEEIRRASTSQMQLPSTAAATADSAREDSGMHTVSRFDYVMTDHPAWTSHGTSRSRAFAMADNDASIVTIDGASQLAHSGRPPACDGFTFSIEDGDGSSQFGPDSALAHMGHVGRYRNPSLWDALATAITRQVVRASQARKMYRNLCRTFGTPVVSHDERPSPPVMDVMGDDAPSSRDLRALIEHWTLPSPLEVLELTDADFASVGMAFKRRALRSASVAYLEHHDEWAAVSAVELVGLLQRVSYIGPWTAAAAVADHTNDWSLYAYDDLAVRTWARRAMPEVRWADDELTFARQWRHLSGSQLASATLLTLAWGDRYVRSDAVSRDTRGS